MLVTCAVRMVASVIAALSLAMVGPFGTYEQGGFGERFWYWLVLTVVSVFLACALKAFAHRFMGDWRVFPRELVVVTTMTALFTPFVQVWTLYEFPGFAGTPPGFWMFAVAVFAICAAISVIVHGFPLLAQRYEGEIEAAPPPRLVSRLPDTFSGQVERLSVKGHKVLVFTDQGLFELRMRFADAVNELAGLEGFCTHRSHWVTRAAIAEVKTENGRPVVQMTSGDEVPVSRKYQPNLEDAGIL